MSSSALRVLVLRTSVYCAVVYRLVFKRQEVQNDSNIIQFGTTNWNSNRSAFTIIAGAYSGVKRVGSEAVGEKRREAGREA